MKIRSILAAALAIILLVCAVPAAAADCTHEYALKEVPATCIEKAKTVYTCALCGDTYTVYADEYTLPEEFYILAKSEKRDGQLVVTVTMGNTPGLYALTLRFKCSAALRPVLCENGDVWLDEEVMSDGVINPTVYYAEHIDLNRNNEKNGIVCTVYFDILDADAPYDFDIDYRRGDIMDADRVSHLPLLINVVGKSELGDHDYVSETESPTCTMTGAVMDVCTVCGDTVILEELSMVDHTWARTVVREPTYTEEGLARDVCQVCGKELEIPLPVLTRWKTGDVNNDGQLSAADLVELNRVVAKGTKEKQKFDAADIDADGDVNSADTILLRRILAGTMPSPDDWK